MKFNRPRDISCGHKSNNDMGYLAHVCTTYRVTHGDGRFNHCCGELSRFLNEYEYEDPETGALRSVVDWEDENGEDMELSREGLRRLVKELRENPDGLPELSDGLGGVYAPERLALIFGEWLETADPDNDFVRIEWY